MTGNAKTTCGGPSKVKDAEMAMSGRCPKGKGNRPTEGGPGAGKEGKTSQVRPEIRKGAKNLPNPTEEKNGAGIRESGTPNEKIRQTQENLGGQRRWGLGRQGAAERFGTRKG